MSATARKDGVVKTRTYNPGTQTRGWEFVVEKRPAGQRRARGRRGGRARHGQAGGQRAQGSGADALALGADHPRDHRAPHRARSHRRLRSQLRGHELREAHGPRQAEVRIEAAEHLRGSHASRRRVTVGFDDDGVKAQKWPIIREGILVGLQTNRETAHYIGENVLRGCTFANHWRNYPFLRMPNIQMEAGPPGSPTLDQMIADVKDGVLVEGQGSFSIDQQRYNGQFGGDAFWEIKNGKKTRMVTDFTYNAITTDFWANLDAVGPPETLGAPRHGRRRQGPAGAVEPPVARLRRRS